jgi:sporulation-control protein spo0M
MHSAENHKPKDRTMTSTPTLNTIPTAIISRVERAAKTVRDNGRKEIGIRSQGLLDGILFAVEAMGFDASEIDALCDLADDIIAGIKL